MKDFEGVLAMQVDAIVANLRHLQEERSSSVIRQAESQAQELRRAIHRRLIKQGREAVRDERRRRDKALKMAEHRIHVEAGQRMQARYAELLRAAWPALVAELERRWSDAEARASWCESIVDAALHAFGRTAWTIEHPLDWTEVDSDRVSRMLDDHRVPPATFRLDESAASGLRVRNGTACLDGTIDGLLAERTQVEGRLLAAWEQQNPERGHEEDD